MATITATTRGQVTLRKEYLHHLGIRPGEKMEIEMLPGGKLMIQAVSQTGRLEALFGCLAGQTNVRLTIEEIREAIAEAGAEAGMAGLKQ